MKFWNHLLFSMMITGALFTRPAFAQTQNLWRWDGLGQYASVPAPDQTQDFEFIAQNHSVIVFAEEHYTPSVQTAQAQVLSELVRHSHKRMALAWEFLPTLHASDINTLWSQVLAGQVSVEHFVKTTQKSDRALVYAPLFEVAKNHGLSILSVNLTREQKAPVLRAGIEGLDPALLPPGFSMTAPGFSAGYWQRFEEAMSQGGHATPEQIKHYYEAQCLTDDFVAHQIERSLTGQNPVEQVVLIMGAFHADFGDGVLARLRERLLRAQIPLSVSGIRFTGYLGPTDWVSSTYGPLAPYLIDTR